LCSVILLISGHFRKSSGVPASESDRRLHFVP
jgi:hypothetical protein